MSLSQSFFPSETEETLHPQFTRTLKGFNPAEVDSYVVMATRRIEVLETHLDKTVEERDRLRHELASVKADVYKNAGERLAGILRGIDDHVDGVRRQAEEDAGRRIAEAEQRAEALKCDAEAEAARIRLEAEGVLERAKAESAKVLGELEGRRDAVRGEIEGLRGILRSLLGRLDDGESPSVPDHVEAPAVDTEWDVEIDDAPDIGDLSVGIDEPTPVSDES